MILLGLQLVGVIWSFGLRTANDKLDAAEKAVIYLIEAAATSLTLAAAYVAEAGSAGDEVAASGDEVAASGEPGQKDLTHL